jgi:dUTP pyrophosphatase
MQKPQVKFKLIHKNAKLPEYKRDGDAAFDVSSVEELIIKPGEWKAIPIGIASEFPKDWFISFRDRSGLALNHGLHVLGGVLDSGYRGEWKIILINHGKKNYKIEVGERVAQAILHWAPQIEIVEVDELTESEERGEKGFGSSGRK